MTSVNDKVTRMMRRKAFRLKVDDTDLSSFFRQLPNAQPDLGCIPTSMLMNLSRPTSPGILTNTEKVFFSHLGDVWVDDEGIAELSASLMELFKYHDPLAGRDNAQCTIEKRTSLTFDMNDIQQVEVEVAAAVCRYGEFTALVLNASGKNPNRGIDYEPTIAAAAIAAFRRNNLYRMQHGRGPQMCTAIPCIAMVGVAPIFYRVFVTSELASSLHRPAQTLIMKRLVPPVENPGRYIVDGMAPLENRRIVFRCLEAFKGFVLDGYTTFPFELLASNEGPWA